MSEETITINRRQLATYIAQTRLALSRTLGQSTAFEGDRKYYDVLGYPKTIAIESYVQRYERQDLAGRIVDLPAIDTWRHPPIVSEDGNRDTPFAKDWQALANRLHVWAELSRADRLSGIGRFGVVLLGLRDGNPLEAAAKRDLGGPKALAYLRPLGEQSVEIRSLEKDTKSERFGLPTEYELKLSGGEVKAHWTRVLHLADGKLDSSVYGTPRLQRVFNRLDDLLKLIGGSAEATWLGMRPGTLFRPQEGFDTDDISTSDLKDEIDNYVHDPMRMMWLAGIEAQQLGPSEVIDIDAPFRSALALIAAATGIPQRVLIGSAQGELAAAREDARQWAGTITARQSSYAEPEILRPFIDHLVWLGVLRPPGAASYNVGIKSENGEWKWPPLNEMSELEQADITAKRAAAVAALPQGLGPYALADAEIRALLGAPATGGPPVASRSLAGNQLSVNAINEAISNYREGYLTAEELARFATSVLVAEGSELASQQAETREKQGRNNG